MNGMKTVITICFIVLSIASFGLAIITYFRKRDLKFLGIYIPKEKANSNDLYIKAYRFETIACILLGTVCGCAAASDIAGGNKVLLVPISLIMLVCYYIGFFRLKRKIEDNK